MEKMIGFSCATCKFYRRVPIDEYGAFTYYVVRGYCCCSNPIETRYGTYSKERTEWYNVCNCYSRETHKNKIEQNNGC